jgi:Anion-transporting ATPase
LTVFCGKGGVGRTTLSLAMGLLSARRGLRTVVVTSHPLPELAVSVSLQGLREALPSAAERLFVVHIDPREILTAKVRQQIPSRLLANAVVSSRLYLSLVEVAPGLKEIAFLARLRQLAETRTQDSGGFDRLVWDAPATGHFLQMLRASRDFQAYMSGPFAVLGRELSAFFADPSRLAILPVTTPEEMAVAETIELCDRLDSEFRSGAAAVVCNLSSPLISADNDEIDRLRALLPGGGIGQQAGFALERIAIERELFRKLRSSVNAPLFAVERRVGWKSDLELLLGLSDTLDGFELRARA